MLPIKKVKILNQRILSVKSVCIYLYSGNQNRIIIFILFGDIESPTDI